MSDQTETAELRARRASRLLDASLFGVGVLTAILVGRLSGAVWLGVVGIAVSALALILLAVPAGLRTRIALALAAVLTAGAALSGIDAALLLAPPVALAWVTALVPWRVARGFALAASLPWRILCALFVALPALLLISAALTGTVDLEVVGWAIVAITLLIALSLASGVRSAAIVAAVIGLVTLVLTVSIPGLLVIGTWWAGALLYVIGIAALVAWGARPDTAGDPEAGLAVENA